MTDVIEGMARAMWAADGFDPVKDAHLADEMVHLYTGMAQAALDYLKQPTPASKPLPEGQGPEMTVEQIEAMNLEARKEAMRPVWQPIVDCLRGDAP